MKSAEQRNVDVVLRYFDVGCNTGDPDDLLPTLAEDVVHYFLPDSVPTIRGREDLARFWAEVKRTMEPTWRIDEIIGAGELVVSEWSLRWRPSGTGPWVITRGTEWYVMRDGVIAEIRAYYADDRLADTQLADFPYAERGLSPARMTALSHRSIRAVRTGLPSKKLPLPTIIAPVRAVSGSAHCNIADLGPTGEIWAIACPGGT